jgi:hypothetical protein
MASRFPKERTRVPKQSTGRILALVDPPPFGLF